MVTSDGIELEAEAAWPALPESDGGGSNDDSSGPASSSSDGSNSDDSNSDDSSSDGTGATVVVLSHPHPLYGGDMWNPLVDHLFRALPASGIATLRYNFRGVGKSGGSHDDGKAEQLDAAAAFDAASRWAAERTAPAAEATPIATPTSEVTHGGDIPAPQVVSAGWSFGGDVSLAADHDGLAAWIGIAAPLRIVNPAAMSVPTDPRPKLLLVPEHDQFRSPAEATDITQGWTNTQLEVIAGGDHFLMGHARTVAEHIATFARGL